MSQQELSLSEAQQYFLQIMINKKVIDQNNFKHVFNSVLRKFDINVTESMFKEYYTRFLKEINDVIRRFNMEIKMTYCEYTALTFFCIIRQCDTGQVGTISQLYTSIEQAIFKKLVELIVESEDGFVSYANAVNELLDYFEGLADEAATQAQRSKVPSPSEMRAAVEKFIHDYWIVEVPNQPGMISLHGRAIVELSQYITQLYKDTDDVLSHCRICKHLLLNGIYCKECHKTYHRFCAKMMFKKSSDCPNCRHKFDDHEVEKLSTEIKKAREVFNSAPSSTYSMTQV